MDFEELVRERFSARSYLDRPVEKEKIEAILEAGRLAPSAKNLQPTRVLVAEGAEALSKISKGANLYGAPLALVAVSERDAAWTRPFDGKNFGDIDASIVVSQMMYAAQDLGLRSVWIGYFDPAVMKKELDLDDGEEVSSVLAVGYSSEQTSRNHGNRIAMSEFARRLRRISIS